VQTLDEGARVCGDEQRVRAETPCGTDDHRVRRVVSDVHDGRQVPVDPGALEHAADPARLQLGEREVVALAELPGGERRGESSAGVRRPACSSPVMFRANRTTPPTRVSQRSRSTAWFPSASVPSKPTSRSWPRSVSSAARRTGSSGGYVRQPAAATTRRLAATSRRNEPLHPPPIDGIPHVAALLDR